jgi:antitoxin PrlF
MMATVFKEVSTITAKGQTTVPKSVRQALGLHYGDRIVFEVDDEHGVSIVREVADRPDPVIDGFLTFLARDMEARPDTLSTLPPALVSRMADLTKGMKVELDAPIDGEVDL